MASSEVVQPCCSGDIFEGYAPLGIEQAIGGIESYVAHPEKVLPKAGVVVIHDIFGWTLPNTRAICDMVAEKGYVCVMPNLYPGGAWPVEESPADNFGKPEFMKKFMGWIRENSVEKNVPILGSYLDAFREKYSSLEKVGIVGFCWGGALMHVASLQAKEVCITNYDCGVSWYGCRIEASGDNEGCGSIQVPTFFGWPGNDTIVTPAQREILTELLKNEAQAKYETHIYPEQGHGFIHRFLPKNEEDQVQMRIGRQHMWDFLAKHLST